MRRREVITLLGGAAAAWPIALQAQQPERMRRVGVLMNLSENDPEAQGLVAAFREGLAQLGWIDGRNVRIDYRWSGGDLDRIRRYAADWSRSRRRSSWPMAGRPWGPCNR
jgi:hypothetical protein